MSKPKKISPFRLTSLLHRESNPTAALRLFLHPSPPFRHSPKSYDLILCKLAKARMFPELQQILAQMSADARVAAKEPLFCRLIAFFGRARHPAAALEAFKSIPSFRCHRTIRSFNALAHAFLQCGDVERVRELCCRVGEYDLAPDVCTYNVLMRAEALFGSLDRARQVFDEMLQRGVSPNEVSFGTLVAALCAKSMIGEAFRVKETMLSSFGVKPNVHVYTSLIKGLCKNGELDGALKLKDEVLLDPEMKVDCALYSTLIRALFRLGRKGEVVGILEEMKRFGVKPDLITYNAMIAGFCEDEKDFDAAFETLNEMVRNECRPDVVTYNTMIAGLCKVGRWRDAKELLDDMPRRECRPDVVSYRTLFHGMCETNDFEQARLVLEEMIFKGFRPGAVSVRKFVKELLSSRHEDWSLVASTLHELLKINAFEIDAWEELVTSAMQESKWLKVGNFIDDLRNS